MMAGYDEMKHEVACLNRLREFDPVELRWRRGCLWRSWEESLELMLLALGEVVGEGYF